MVDLKLCGTEGENHNLDLSKFMSFPLTLQKSSMTLLILIIVLSSIFANRRTSSVKRRWDIFRSWFLSLKGFYILLFTADEIWMERYSIGKMKRYGEKGSPWRMPLFGIKEYIFSPLRMGVYS